MASERIEMVACDGDVLRLAAEEALHEETAAVLRDFGKRVDKDRLRLAAVEAENAELVKEKRKILHSAHSSLSLALHYLNIEHTDDANPATHARRVLGDLYAALDAAMAKGEAP